MTEANQSDTSKRTHFPLTTFSQRKLLFKTWEDSGCVKIACRTAHVSERTFYKWKPRFKAGGYEALKEFKSHAPKNPKRTAKEVEEKVVTLRKTHPNWGKHTIANELTKENNWVPLVSPNTVRRILEDAGLWKQITENSPPKGPSGKARTAEKPCQCINVDLAFVPVSHEIEKKLPAVSGSSGRLVVEQLAEDTEKVPQWPGRVFEDTTLSYEEAMEKFAAASATQSKESEPTMAESSCEEASVKAQKRAIRQEEEKLRSERRQIRTQRKQEDTDWREFRSQLGAQKAGTKTPKQTPQVILTEPAPCQVPPAELNTVAHTLDDVPQAIVFPTSEASPLPPCNVELAVSASNDTAPVLTLPESAEPVKCSGVGGSASPESRDSYRKEQSASSATSAPSITDEQRRQHQDKRRAQLAQREKEDEQWRSKRKSIRERLAELPIVTSWFAILVIIDNCTRVCYGLPLFITGAKVTAEEVVNALQSLLPPELMFLISDRGVHFRAKVFEALAKNKEFLHVFTARHRPQSNGIAERFVRTLKEWLADKTWSSEEELLALLSEFQAMYNERPHQGIPVSGLSPNEYARRILEEEAA
jgi:transposase